jgi:hypothetical protein
MKSIFAILIIPFFVLPIHAQEAFLSDEQTLLITESPDIHNVEFDGKWSFVTEWKKSSWEQVKSDDGFTYHLRYAHQGDYIYFLIDVQSDTQADFDNDKAVICIDSDNNKTKLIDENDYCFVTKLSSTDFFGKLFNQKHGLILNGYEKEFFEELKKIEHSEFVGIGTISDDQDRYTKTPHSSYEFKIPTDLVGRSDNYGIFVSVYDYESNSVYSWPIGIQSDVEKIPSPSTWGNLVSPDKSLPEFDIPLLIIISSLLGVTLFSRKISFPKVI